ncbi:MAG: glycine cleavage T C-terminal barrel domain-containing protein [Anaerolineae bacterium]
MNDASYTAALTGTACYRLPQPGLLRIAGEGRLDFIQRQTTNDARLLTAGRSLLTVLTSPTARILDVWRLLLSPDGEAVDAITLPGRGPVTAQYLARRIFFMDRVTVSDLSAQSAQLWISGPTAPHTLRQVGFETLPAPGEVMSLHLASGPVRLLAQEGALGQGYLALGGQEDVNALTQRLTEQGAATLDPDTVEVLRVEAGIPGPARELTDAHTPLEVNLDSAIHGAKGCYTGQEVLARQINYDKVARRLCGLRLDAPVSVGATVLVEGRSAGEVTSATISPRHGPIALAVLRRPHFAPGTPVRVTDAAGEVSGTVAALPFAMAT